MKKNQKEKKRKDPNQPGFFKRKLEKMRLNQQLGETNQLSKDYAPNAYIQPLHYQKWKLMGKVFDYQNELHLGKEAKPFREFVYRFSNNFGGVVGFLIVVILVLCAVIIPFTAQDPNVQNINNRTLTFWQYDSTGQLHILGTDDLGRDLWSRLWNGLQYSIGLATVITLIEVVIGISVGIAMGQFEKFDKVMTFIIKILTVVPNLLILILIVIILNPTFWVLVFALSITSWTGMANQLRAQVKRAKTFEWVAASKVLGTPTHKVLYNYIPVVLPILITQLVFTIPGVIIAETSLAFIGLSIQNVATLGGLISDGQKLYPAFFRYVFVPSIILILITTSVQLIGASVQDALRRQR